MEKEHPLVSITRYGTRNWAVWVGAELLCVVVYKKGAKAVQNALLNLFSALPVEATKERAA